MFHRAGVILDEETAARVMSPIAASENRACRNTWDQISWRGVNRLGERDERIRKALAILKKRPTSSASLSKQLGVERHTVADYLRPFVVAGEIERVKYVIGGQRLILGDCLEVMQELGPVDAVVTDPPYGIGEDGGAQRTRGKPGYAKHESKGWDKSRPTNDVFEAIFSLSKSQVIWGGNYFADLFPPTMGWFYWRKLMGGDFSDGELAWTSRKGALREFVKCPKGIDKKHPCEKPVALMEWCLGFLPDAQTILDPFMGSGTTLVACQKLGRGGIGIEIDPDYFEIACKRVDEASRQPDLFVEPTPKPEQTGMDL